MSTYTLEGHKIVKTEDTGKRSRVISARGSADPVPVSLPLSREEFRHLTQVVKEEIAELEANISSVAGTAFETKENAWAFRLSYLQAIFEKMEVIND